MFGIIAEVLTLARKFTSYQLDATAGALWTDTQHFKVVCPAGKRWFVVAGSLNRGISSTLDARVYDVDDVVLYMIDSQAATTGVTAFPNKTANAYINPGHPMIMDATDYLEIAFGVAQDASSWASFTVLEIPYP